MNCREIKPFLGQFLDEELCREKSLEIKAHLEKCRHCSDEAVLLKKSWDLLRQNEPVAASPGFKNYFWKRLAEKELAFEKKKIIVFPGLKPRLAAVFSLVAVILICGTYVRNSLSDKGIQNLAMLINDKDISMLKDLDLMEDLDVIENIPVLDELKVMDSVEL
jgi:hypothetical protein